MYSKIYTKDSEETGSLVLRITSIGYGLMLLSVIFGLGGVYLEIPALYLSGMVILISFLVFMLSSIEKELPNFSLEIELPSTQVKAKQFLTMSVRVDSDQIKALVVSIEGSSGIFPVLKPNQSILMPSTARGSSFILYTPRRGKEKIYRVRLSFSGLPGLFYYTTEVQTNIDIIVLPQPQRIQLPWTLKQRIFDQFISEISISRRGRGDEFLSLRDFQFGDEIRNIHWKASAKWGKLISKEFEEPIQLRFLIVVDRSMLMAGPKLEFALSSIIELSSVIRTSNHSCTILVHGDQYTWKHNLGVSPSSLNRLAILLHAVEPEGTAFNFKSLDDYIVHHRLTDTVMIIISDLESNPEDVQAGRTMLIPHVQRMLYFACFTPGFSSLKLVGPETTIQTLDQYYYPNVILRSKVALEYRDREGKYNRVFSGSKSKFHLISSYNTNILLELRDTLSFMGRASRARIAEGVS